MHPTVLHVLLPVVKCRRQAFGFAMSECETRTVITDAAVNPGMLL